MQKKVGQDRPEGPYNVTVAAIHIAKDLSFRFLNLGMKDGLLSPSQAMGSRAVPRWGWACLTAHSSILLTAAKKTR
jgi:hypothetical protein